MNEWWEQHGVRAYRRTECWFCEAQLAGTNYFIPFGRNTDRYRTWLDAMQVCALCCMREYAIIEAKDECRKFVAIEAERCVCGRVQISAIGECIACHRERRMLDKQWAEIKQARRILQSIRKEIKIGKTAFDGGTSGALV